LGPCIARPSKIICIGLNYAKHATEAGMDKPKEPLVFFKSTSAICGPNDDLIIPRNSEKTDWEVELAVVIGKKASYVTKETALDYVAGYCVHNDYSERAFQLEKGGQWVKGKSNDTFAPLGPFLATADEVTNPQKLNLWLKRNGKKIQDSNTDDMIFYVDEIVSYLSNYMTLLPGDVISTGTPSGVGLGFKPPVFIKEGDIMELGIEGLGIQTQTAKAYKA
jgi:2,4-diketo-3-deoxy-L-fuconate hydrolase